MRSKAFIAIFMAFAVMFSLFPQFTVGASADHQTALPSDTDKGIEIAKASTAPIINGRLDDVYTQIYSFSGRDAWNAAPAGGNKFDYGLLTIPATSIERYFYGDGISDHQIEGLLNSRVKGYAAWDSEKVYFFCHS